jgi:hypothetical protein
MIDNSITEINSISGNVVEKPDLPDYLKFDTLQILKKEIQVAEPLQKLPQNSNFIISLGFATALSVGSILWFILLGQFIYRCRKKISIKALNITINSLGIALAFFGAFIFYKALSMIF